MGFTWLKMDLGINLIQDRPGMVTHPLGMNPTRDTALTAHPFTGVEITDKGIEADVRVCGDRAGSDRVGHSAVGTTTSGISA